MDASVGPAVCGAFAGGTRPRHRDVLAFLAQDKGLARARARHGPELTITSWLGNTPPMLPVAAARTWAVPPLESVGALADWARLSVRELEWFSDLKALTSKRDQPQLNHYHYRVLTKQSGAVRLIEAPKPRLKEVQQRILAEILAQVPSHDAVHGFVKGRSIKTFAAPHVGQRVVLRMDLRDFFPSLGRPRVQALFRTMGYPEAVADLLGGLCTNVAPRKLWQQVPPGVEAAHWQEARLLYTRPHLPQGAPTSPALANLCAYRADCRLQALAESASAVYTRYADDLAFSGGEAFTRCAGRFFLQAAVVLQEEGFHVHHRKTRIMRQSVRQHLAGLVTNAKLNVRRTDFDQLKAILTNCVRHGPESQNREGHPSFRSHLEGGVAFMEMVNAARGQRLHSILEQIRWP